jgi:adenosylhomocysteine nucleosidase
MIGITFALPTESSDLRRRLSEVRRENDLLFGKIDPPSPRLRRAGNHDVVIVHTGVGAKHCNERMEALLHKARPRLVISSGFAGAVVDDLQVGDLILAENFSDRELLTRAISILRERKPRVAKLFTSTSIVDSISERNEMARASGAAAVDMETGAIVGVCNAHSVPLLSLRAISDSPKEPFPAPPWVLFDIERQRTDLRKLFGHIITGPTAIIRLLQFFRQIREARAVLTDAMVELVRVL